MPEELKTRPHLIRPTYMRAVQDYLHDLQKGCELYRCDYVRMDTSHPLEVALPQYLVRRLQMSRR